MLAMVFAALVPTVSNALALATGSTQWVEICTAQGARWVAVDDAADTADGSSQPASAGAHLDHCPFCHLGAPGWAPPPATPMWLPLPAVQAGPPERFLTAPHTAHVWCTAQPRAPPLFS